MCVAFLREEVSGVVSISPLILNLLRRLFAHACDAMHAYDATVDVTRLFRISPTNDSFS